MSQQDEEMESPSLIGRKRNRDDKDQDNDKDKHANANENATDTNGVKRVCKINDDAQQLTLKPTATATPIAGVSVTNNNLTPLHETNINIHSNGNIIHEYRDLNLNSKLLPVIDNGTKSAMPQDTSTLEMARCMLAKSSNFEAPVVSLAEAVATTHTVIEASQDGNELTKTVTSSQETQTSKASTMKVILGLSTMFIINTCITIFLLSLYLMPSATITMRDHPNIIPPSHTYYHATRTRKQKQKNNWHNVDLTASSSTGSGSDNETTMIHNDNDRFSTMTLRQFLSHDDGFHLGLAPAFFGFYVYFGALTAFHEHVLTEEQRQEGKVLLPVDMDMDINRNGYKKRAVVDQENDDNSGIYHESDEDNAYEDHDDDSYLNDHDEEQLSNTGILVGDENATIAPSSAAINQPIKEIQKPLLKSVAGASAGAMAAVLIAAGLNPRESANFASTMTVDKFWDFPGLGGLIKGDLFEDIMVRRVKRSGLSAPPGAILDEVDHESLDNVRLEDGLIPVAVSGFDIFNLQGKIITKGCMGKAARASATFPGLFQPCKWNNNDSGNASDNFQYLVDGGLSDVLGLNGLGHLRQDERNKRVVNLVAGAFGATGPLGPSNLPEGIHAKEVVSISIENAPQCGPWAMQNGPIALQAAMDAIKDVLDVPMYHGDEEGHYVLHVDVAAFVTN